MQRFYVRLFVYSSAGVREQIIDDQQKHCTPADILCYFMPSRQTLERTTTIPSAGIALRTLRWTPLSKCGPCAVWLQLSGSFVLFLSFHNIWYKDILLHEFLRQSFPAARTQVESRTQTVAACIIVVRWDLNTRFCIWTHHHENIVVWSTEKIRRSCSFAAIINLFICSWFSTMYTTFPFWSANTCLVTISYLPYF